VNGSTAVVAVNDTSDSREEVEEAAEAAEELACAAKGDAEAGRDPASEQRMRVRDKELRQAKKANCK